MLIKLKNAYQDPKYSEISKEKDTKMAGSTVKEPVFL
jgi:hypothetical protein